MSQSRTHFGRLALLVLIVLVAAYGLFEARRYLAGPSVTIDTPKSYQTLGGPAVHVSGHGENLSYLYINGTQAFLDEHGTISFVYTPPSGYTVLTAEARDRFGRSVRITIPFIVK